MNKYNYILMRIQHFKYLTDTYITRHKRILKYIILKYLKRYNKRLEKYYFNDYLTYKGNYFNNRENF